MEANSLLNLGGPIVYILLALSVYATAIIFYKLHIFYKVNFFKSDRTARSVKNGLKKTMMMLMSRLIKLMILKVKLFPLPCISYSNIKN